MTSIHCEVSLLQLRPYGPPEKTRQGEISENLMPRRGWRCNDEAFPEVFWAEKNWLTLAKIQQTFGKIWVKFARFWKKNQQKRQQFLTEILRLESGAKECIV